jgi:hypothetical protein
MCEVTFSVCSKQEMWKATFHFHHSLSISNGDSTTWLLSLKPTMVELRRILVRCLVTVLVLVVLRVTLPLGLIEPWCVCCMSGDRFWQIWCIELVWVFPHAHILSISIHFEGIITVVINVWFTYPNYFSACMLRVPLCYQWFSLFLTLLELWKLDNTQNFCFV